MLPAAALYGYLDSDCLILKRFQKDQWNRYSTAETNPAFYVSCLKPKIQSCEKCSRTLPCLLQTESIGNLQKIIAAVSFSHSKSRWSALSFRGRTNEWLPETNLPNHVTSLSASSLLYTALFEILAVLLQIGLLSRLVSVITRSSLPL